MSRRNTNANTARNLRNTEREAKERALSELIDSTARYLVFYDGRIVASFASEDDALLFEAELAELDRDHNVRCVECRVFDRKGNLVGGYTITAGLMVNTVEDKDWGRKYSTRRPR